jgi:hypothetical protein
MTSGNTGPQRSNYARMECPVTGCMSARGGAPMEGTVPGIKRHVLRVHGRSFYDAATWPALYRNSVSFWGDRVRASKLTPPKPFEEMNIHELRAAAKLRGIPQRDKNKPDFIAALNAAWQEERFR